LGSRPGARGFLAWLALALIAGAGACSEPDMKTIKQFERLNDEVAERIEDVTITYSDSGRIQARLEAPVMLRYTKKYQQLEMPQGVHASFFNKKGLKDSELWADYGVRKLDAKMTIVSGNVKVINTKGDTLLSEHLIWDERAGKIFTDQYVEVRTPKEIIMAEGFESDPNFSNYRFYDIKGTITVEQD
jgi:LPS export ABC transporter protein LptC